MAANTWTNGSTDGKWSTITNWSLGHVPTATETATFDATSDTACAIDAAPNVLGIVIAAGYAHTITQGAVDITIGAGGFTMGAGTFTGAVAKLVICAGNFTRTAGTITSDVLNLKMTGAGTSCAWASDTGFASIWITGYGVTLNNSFIVGAAASGLRVDAGGWLINSAASKSYVSMYWGGYFTNNGIITGTQTLQFTAYNANYSITFGSVSCPILISASSAATGNYTASIAGNAVLGGALTVSSAHASNTMTLDLAGFNLTCTTMTVSTRAILTTTSTGAYVTGNVILSTASSVMSQTAGCALTITGNYTQTDGAVTTGGVLTITGTVTMTAGTFVQGAYDISYGAMAMNGGTWTGVATNWQTCSGNWTYAGGTNSLLQIIMTGDGTTLKSWSTVCMLTFKISANVTITSDGSRPEVQKLIVDTGKTLTIAASQVLRIRIWSGASYDIQNSGTINGPGTLELTCYNANKSFSLGTVNAPLTFRADSGETNSYTFTLLTDAIVGGAFTLVSDHAARTITLDLGGRAFTSQAITDSTRGIILSSVVGASLHSGDITVSANGTLTEANIAVIESSGTVDLSAGTYTPSAARWVLTGTAKALKLAAGHKLYDLIVTGGASISLTANATVSNEIVMASPISVGAFTLTHEGGGAKWYDRRRLHFQRSISRRIDAAPGDAILDYLGKDWSVN
jgi:hypothetical protein